MIEAFNSLNGAAPIACIKTCKAQQFVSPVITKNK